MKIQKFGTDGLALVHSADGREKITMTREQAFDVMVQLSAHFPDDKDKRIADLVANVEKLKRDLAVARVSSSIVANFDFGKQPSTTAFFRRHYDGNDFRIEPIPYDDVMKPRPSSELIPYIPQEAKQPPASILKDDPAHWSDCAVYNAPALPVGPCDCGGLKKVKSANNLPEHSAFGYESKSANKSAESHANALRGPLETDTQASRELGNAWKWWKA